MRKIWKKSLVNKQELETKDNELNESYKSLLQSSLKDQDILMKERYV